MFSGAGASVEQYRIREERNEQDVPANEMQIKSRKVIDRNGHRDIQELKKPDMEAVTDQSPAWVAWAAFCQEKKSLVEQGAVTVFRATEEIERCTEVPD